VGPYEFAALLIVIPIVLGAVWIMRRFETDGVPAPEFEAWCARARPVVFAIRCASNRAAAVASRVARALGAEREVEHHRGRYPWTRYLFVVTLDVSPLSGVVVGRIERCVMRRGAQKRPELGAVIDRVAADLGADTRALWVHAELHADDDDNAIAKAAAGSRRAGLRSRRLWASRHGPSSRAPPKREPGRHCPGSAQQRSPCW
jgi:hypothetical protein